jgi:hypothetical protein
METKLVSGLTLFFDAEDLATAEIVGEACERSVQLMRELWGLDVPRDCRVYVMTSWMRFVFHSAPWHWRILLGATLPLWSFRAQRMWQYAGGWAQRYGERRAIGVKPPRLIQAADRSMGEQIFVPEKDMNEKVQHITCHELVHAFTAHLRLPAWLNEGLAMVTVDRLLGKPTVRSQTIEALGQRSQGTRPKEYRSLGARDKESLVYHCVRGYWITRYLADTRPELLRDLLQQRQGRKALENKVAAGLGMSREEFWKEIDGIVSAWS